MAAIPDLTVGSADQFRAALILEDMLGVPREHADLRDQCVAKLVRYDEGGDREPARLLLTHL